MFDSADLVRQCRKAAATEVAFESDDDLLIAAVSLQAARSALDAAEARVLGELRVRGVTDARFGQKTARWVAAQAKVDHRPIRRRERLGVGLRQLPVVDGAVVDGSISADHAAVLTEAASNPRVGAEVAATQSVWVDLAAETSFADWKRQLEQTVALLDQDGGYDPARDLGRNRLHFVEMPEGVTSIRGDLVGVEALQVRDLVEAEADRLFHRMKQDEARTADLPLPSRATLRALALADLVRRGAVLDRDKTDGPAVDITLVLEADTAGASASDAVGDAPGVSPGELHDCCGDLHTPDGELVRTDIAPLLLCDPVITALVIDMLGVPLDMGRKIRLVNRNQRRALTRRDGGCIFPGCDVPASWCDAHHVIWWEHQGPTDIANLGLLCRYHHGVTHRKGWSLTAAGDQWFTWTTPSGDTLHSQRHRGRSPTGHPGHPALTPAA